MRLMSRTATQTLKALLELAQEPTRWRSVSDLATSQGLPAPYLEQLLLRLRRAGVLEARRGRQGGYRLACAPASLPLGRVLGAVGAWPTGEPARTMLQLDDLHLNPGDGAPDAASERVAVLLQQRLAQSLERELERLTLEDLLFDWRSARAGLSEEGGLMLG